MYPVIYPKDSVLIDPDTRRTEVLRITAEGVFVFYAMSELATQELTSIGCKVAMAEVFAGIDVGA